MDYDYKIRQSQNDMHSEKAQIQNEFAKNMKICSYKIKMIHTDLSRMKRMGIDHKGQRWALK